MDKTEEKVLVAGIDVARDRVEISVFGWARVGYTASYIGVLSRKLGWIGSRTVRPAAPRPWLRQNKGRGAQL
jgi:hypothetical protein